MGNDPWFYLSAGHRQGPVTYVDLIQKLLSGELSEHTPVWQKGRHGWTPALQVPDISAHLPPPVPRDLSPLEAIAEGVIRPAFGPSSAHSAASPLERMAQRAEHDLLESASTNPAMHPARSAAGVATASDSSQQPNHVANIALILGTLSVFLWDFILLPLAGFALSIVAIASSRRRSGAGKWRAWVAAALSSVYLSVAVERTLSRQWRRPATPSIGATLPQTSGGSTRGFLGSEGTSLSANDERVINRFPTARWNKSAAPLVRGYLDPTVTPAEWVRSANAPLNELRGIASEMNLQALSVEDPGLRRTFQELAANYRAKVDALTAIHVAVAQGDAGAERSANEALSAVNVEGQRLAERLLASIRPHVPAEELRESLEKKGAEARELMKQK